MDKNSKLRLRTGNEIPVMGLGTWQLTKETTNAVSYAIGLGYRLIDTSSDYGTQPGIGEAIRKTTIDRKEIYITTKVEETDDAYERTKSNLKELGLDYVDLTLIHRPPVLGAGEDLWRGLIQAKNEGFTLDIGVSNYSISLIDKLIEETGEIPTINQIEWSPFGFSQKMKDYCSEKNIIIQAYSPLTRTKRLDDERLIQVATKYDKTLSQILIRWNLQLGTVPIPKANQKPHLEENINVFDFEIANEDMDYLCGLDEDYSSLGSLLYI